MATHLIDHDTLESLIYLAERIAGGTADGQSILDRARKALQGGAELIEITHLLQEMRPYTDTFYKIKLFTAGNGILFDETGLATEWNTPEEALPAIRSYHKFLRSKIYGDAPD